MYRLPSSGVVTLRARYVAVNGKCILINNSDDNIDLLGLFLSLSALLIAIKWASIVVSINFESMIIRYDRVGD